MFQYSNDVGRESESNELGNKEDKITTKQEVGNNYGIVAYSSDVITISTHNHYSNKIINQEISSINTKDVSINTSPYTSNEDYSITNNNRKSIDGNPKLIDEKIINRYYSNANMMSSTNFTSSESPPTSNSMSIDGELNRSKNSLLSSSGYFVDTTSMNLNCSDDYSLPIPNKSSINSTNVNSLASIQTKTSSYQRRKAGILNNLNFGQIQSFKKTLKISNNTGSIIAPSSGDILQIQLDDSYNASTVSVNTASLEPPKPPQIISPTNCLVYQVQFKRNFRYHVVLPGYNKEIKLNDYVKVYADRGEDLGIVIGFVNLQTFCEMKKQQTRNNSNKCDVSKWELKYIFRLASTYEKQQLVLIHKEENEIIKNANKLIAVYSLPLVIVDVEYQFDKNKLTILYEANKRVDFREFVRDLFAIYKTRIWMEKISYETKKKSSSPVVISNHVSPVHFASNSISPRYQSFISSDCAISSISNRTQSQSELSQSNYEGQSSYSPNKNFQFSHQPNPNLCFTK